MPKIYWQLCTPRLLAIEYAPGIKITNVAALRESGIDTKSLARRATECYLIQLLNHGL